VSLRNGPAVQGQPPQPGYLLGLRDTNGDGKIDVQEKFGTQGATGIRLRNGYLYYSTPTSIERFKMTPGELKPSGPAEVIVGDFPSGQNAAIATRTSPRQRGNVYVNVGLPSNACAEPDRQKGSKGVDPCPQLEEHGGIWFRPTRRQKFEGDRYATGMRWCSTGTTATSTR
jgi:glucose/arabinose dehydrogenase